MRPLTANGLSYVFLHHGALLHRGFLLMGATALSGAGGAVEAEFHGSFYSFRSYALRLRSTEDYGFPPRSTDRNIL